MPAGVVTVTSTVPVPAGLVAVIERVVDHDEARRGGRAEVDGGGAGETCAGDRDRQCRRRSGRSSGSGR